MDENEIKTIEWPAQSPESNIIENVWLKIQIELQKMSETLDSSNQLYENILQIWTNISVDYIRNVHSSILKTYAQRTARGYITKYQRVLISCLNHMKRTWR